MCPMCIPALAWIAAGTSTGGVSALAMIRLRGKKNDETTGEDNEPEHREEDAADRIG
jgi:hypothetical protein